MATSSPTKPSQQYWIWWWFLISSLVVTWDIGYCYLRPRSMPGGDLAWIWAPYAKYIYGFEALETKNGFTNAQTTLNVIESLLNFWYCYLGAKHPLAVLIGFTSVVMTVSKTLLYWFQEYFCDYCSAGHNTLSDAFWFWMVPNVGEIWIVIPGYILYLFAQDLAGSLLVADRATRQVRNGKAH
ncbi:hypothetical protein FS837_005659 [Tulasnella sp. UAMH 9824]|nr:hypothetical protein FS837_005659 [Tulasnella sp. UAMH 9824]